MHLGHLWISMHVGRMYCNILDFAGGCFWHASLAGFFCARSACVAAMAVAESAHVVLLLCSCLASRCAAVCAAVCCCSFTVSQEGVPSSLTFCCAGF
jgi:hypothetical protein